MYFLYQIPPRWEPEDLIPKSIITVRDFFCLLFGISVIPSPSKRSLTKEEINKLALFLSVIDNGFKTYTGKPGEIFPHNDGEPLPDNDTLIVNSIQKLTNFIVDAMRIESLKKLPDKKVDDFILRATSINQELVDYKLDDIGQYFIMSCEFHMFAFNSREFFEWFADNVFDWYKNNCQFLPEEKIEVVERVILKAFKMNLRACEIVNEKVDPFESQIKEDEKPEPNQELLVKNTETENTDNEATEKKKKGQITFERNGATWNVGIDTIRSVKHTVGMLYIEYLLDHPRERVSGLELRKLLGEIGPKKKPMERDGNEGDEPVSLEMEHGTGMEYSEPEFKAWGEAYKEAFGELERAKNKEEFKDEREIEELEKRIEELKKLENKFLDNKGKPKAMKNPVETARKGVLKAIVTARKNILEDAIGMEETLKHIKTSPLFSYNPPL